MKRSAKRTAQKKAPAAPTAAMETMLRRLKDMLGDEGGSPIVEAGDLQALMSSLSGASAYDRLSDAEANAKDEAQQIAFDAMEAESKAQARKLARRALRLDPDCVDALVVIGDLDARNPREAIEGLRRAVAAGERSLGEEFVRENKGHFWGMIETRPYMRALQSLGEVLRGQGFNLDAIEAYEKMLKLNPNDNQGVRSPLLGLYLETGDLKGSARLLKKYKTDASADFAWGRVLERFLAGDLDGAAKSLKAAREANRHMELLLTRKKPFPKQLPDMYSPGSMEEAVLCLSFLGGALTAQPKARLWLFDQLAADGVRHKPSAVALKRMVVRKTVQ